jgi:hypothetical protein
MPPNQSPRPQTSLVLLVFSLSRTGTQTPKIHLIGLVNTHEKFCIKLPSGVKIGRSVLTLGRKGE